MATAKVIGFISPAKLREMKNNTAARRRANSPLKSSIAASMAAKVAMLAKK